MGLRGKGETGKDSTGLCEMPVGAAILYAKVYYGTGVGSGKNEVRMRL